jgi:hypothetical protein
VVHEVEVRPSPGRGRGVFARRAFGPGELVFRRRHQPLTPAEARDLSPDRRDHVCLVGPDRLALVTPPGCYLNHSCAPTAVRHGVAVLALEPIAAGDEVTLDYRLTALDGPAWACRCGAPTCTGVVAGGVATLPPEVRERMRPHIPAWLRAAAGI